MNINLEQGRLQETIRLIIRHDRYTMWQLQAGLSLFYSPATVEAPAQLKLQQKGKTPDECVVIAAQATLCELLPGEPVVQKQKVIDGSGHVMFLWPVWVSPIFVRKYTVGKIEIRS